MKEGWEIVNIGSICNIITGKLDANASSENGVYPFFTCSRESLKIDNYAYDCECVLIAGNGDLNVKYYKGKFNAYQRTYIVTLKNDIKDVSVKYIFKFFEKYVEKLRQLSVGGVIKYIKLGDLTNAKIPVPPLPEQEKIVMELDCLSGIIEKKKQQLKELDSLTQSIFYEMFGDPVENEKGWEVAPLKESVIEMFLGPFGSALKTECYVNQEDSFCMVYEQKHAIRKTLDTETHYINKEKFESLKRFEVHAGDFIMSCRGTIGEVYRLPSNAPLGIIHPSLMKIRIKEDKYSSTFFVNLLSYIIKNECTVGNCIQMAITAKELGQRKSILPPLSLQQQFANKIELIEKQKELIKQSIKETETLFDSRMDYYFNS